MNFADTNWLASIYIEPHRGDAEAVRRRELVTRFMRRTGGQLLISHVVLLEARNIFARITGEREPREWQMLEADFDGRLYVAPLNWDLLRRECYSLFKRYAWKTQIGTFDTAIVASAKLAGARRFLSFDVTARAIAASERIEVYPALDVAGKRLLSELKN